MKCLHCSNEMTNYEVHKTLRTMSYDVCESCGGLWLDKNELDQMAVQVEGDIEYCATEDASDPASAKHCPRCAGEHLRRVKFLGEEDIVLERCDNCSGFWLEGGQIQKINDRLTKLMPVKGTGFSEFLTETHLPHYYKRIKRHSAETDFSTPVLPVQHAKLLGKTSHKCPTCENLLDSYKTYGIKIENCSKCGGLWLHQKELKALKDRIDADSWGNLRWMNDEVVAIEKSSTMVSNKSCPECSDSRLLSTNFGNSKIVIDRCDGCHGVWLEGGEFNEIVHYLREELNHLTSKEMEKKVAEAVKKIWSDGSESKISEVLDAKAAISALICISIYEHPPLAAALVKAGIAGKTVAG